MGACCGTSAEKYKLPDYCVPKPEISDETITLVQGSWMAIIEGETSTYKAKKAANPSLSSVVFFYDTFYDRLFEVAPSVKPMFKNCLSIQGKALVSMMQAGVQLLKNPEGLKKALVDLADRHNNYGAIRAHFDVVGRVLMFTLEACLGDKWSDKVGSAWLHVYSFMMIVMLPNVVEGKPPVQNTSGEGEENKSKAKEEPKPKADESKAKEEAEADQSKAEADQSKAKEEPKPKDKAEANHCPFSKANKEEPKPEADESKANKEEPKPKADESKAKEETEPKDKAEADQSKANKEEPEPKADESKAKQEAEPVSLS